MKSNKLVNRLLSFFFQGILVVVPFVTTAYVLYNVFLFLDNLIPYKVFPGTGVLMVLGLLTLLGALASTIVLKPFTYLFSRFLDRAPLIRTIYNAVKDLVGAFVGKKKSFSQPVLVKLSNDTTIEKLGFITSEDLHELGLDSTKIAVYLPHSYAFSGNLFIVDRRNVTPLSAKSADVMKFIVSGGVAKADAADKE